MQIFALKRNDVASFRPVRPERNSPGQAVLRAALGYSCAIKTPAALKGQGSCPNMLKPVENFGS